MPLYVCRRWEAAVAPQEGQALEWVKPAQLADYPMPPADKPLVAMLRDLLWVSMNSLTVVAPFHNESAHVAAFLARLTSVLAQMDVAWTVLCVGANHWQHRRYAGAAAGGP